MSADHRSERPCAEGAGVPSTAAAETSRCWWVVVVACSHNPPDLGHPEHGDITPPLVKGVSIHTRLPGSKHSLPGSKHSTVSQCLRGLAQGRKRSKSRGGTREEQRSRSDAWVVGEGTLQEGGNRPVPSRQTVPQLRHPAPIRGRSLLQDVVAHLAAETATDTGLACAFLLWAEPRITRTALLPKWSVRRLASERP